MFNPKRIYRSRTECPHPHGEIDLVTQQGAVTVFVEVKTRTSSAYGHPESAITPTKQAHLLASAQAYIQTHPDHVNDWRIDVIAIRRRKGMEPEIVHFENAVGG
ncbi:MAG: YraN family protein [Anaerolineae bacterium]|nr:YraN family protein [Anaerolineae bacterium]